VRDVRRFLRPGRLLGHLLVLLAVLVCLRLAWWQLQRSEEADGTIQNVGYALLWPAFGVAFIYMWVQFIRLESERAAQDERRHDEALTLVLADAEALTAGAAPALAADAEAVLTGMDGTMVESASLGDGGDFVGIVGDEDVDDPELIAYNRALAALAERDRRDR
jgi:DNA-binding transcriptional regulator of glucitol operon